MLSILNRALSWAITSFGNKFNLKKRSRLIKALDNGFYVKFMQLEIGLLINVIFTFYNRLSPVNKKRSEVDCEAFFLKSGQNTTSFIVKTVHACRTSKFLVQPSNAECGGLETTYKDSRQMFRHSDRMFEQIFQISFKISFGT